MKEKNRMFNKNYSNTLNYWFDLQIPWVIFALRLMLLVSILPVKESINQNLSTILYLGSIHIHQITNLVSCGNGAIAIHTKTIFVPEWTILPEICL